MILLWYMSCLCCLALPGCVCVLGGVQTLGEWLLGERLGRWCDGTTM